VLLIDGDGGGREVSALRVLNGRLVQKASPLPSIANRPHRDLKPRVGIKEKEGGAFQEREV
jgi:hypothetical protein